MTTQSVYHSDVARDDLLDCFAEREAVLARRLAEVEEAEHRVRQAAHDQQYRARLEKFHRDVQARNEAEVEACRRRMEACERRHLEDMLARHEARLAQMPIGLERPRQSQHRRPKRSSDGRAPLEALPLFAPDNLLGAALLGPDRIQEWQQLAPLLEARGLPKIDQTMGGRFVPAVRAFFMQQYGLGTRTAFAPDGVEDFETWKQKPKRPV